MTTAPWHGAASPSHLYPEDFDDAAHELGCSPAAIRAVWEVEANGRFFLPDESVIRRFEPHHFPSHYWKRIGFSVRDNEAPWRASLRLSNDAMFMRAATLDLEDACRASSWGAPQIMGFNHKAAGYPDAVSMVEAMACNAENQLKAFVQFILTKGLATHLVAQDWRAFARAYNGSGQVDRYARLMEAAYRKHSGGTSPVILRVGDRGPAVRELQRALGIEDDGAFGPQTQDAVRDFQSRSRLTVDGVVGAQTWSHLRAAPPSQETPADAVAGTVQRYAGAATAATAAAAGAAEVLPDGASDWLLPAAAVLLVVFGVAFAIKWVRK